MRFEKGDRVLVEGVVDSTDEDGGIVYFTKNIHRESPGAHYAGPQFVRPWVEAPPEAPYGVWRGKMRDSSLVAVMSNGVAGFLGSKGNFDQSLEYAADILAEYVRQTAGRKP